MRDMIYFYPVTGNREVTDCVTGSPSLTEKTNSFHQHFPEIDFNPYGDCLFNVDMIFFGDNHGCQRHHLSEENAVFSSLPEEPIRFLTKPGCLLGSIFLRKSTILLWPRFF